MTLCPSKLEDVAVTMAIDDGSKQLSFCTALFIGFS
jgi:hypothetical protein